MVNEKTYNCLLRQFTYSSLSCSCNSFPASDMTSFSAGKALLYMGHYVCVYVLLLLNMHVAPEVSCCKQCDNNTGANVSAAHWLGILR